MPLSDASQWFTPVSTIIGGVIIFVISQGVLKLIIEPVQHLKGVIGQTANTLLRHQSKITNGIEDADLSAKIYDHAAELVSKAEVIVWYGLVRCMFGLPSRAAVVEAAQELNAVGHWTKEKRPNALGLPSQPSAFAARKNHEALKKIAALLKVKTAYQ